MVAPGTPLAAPSRIVFIHVLHHIVYLYILHMYMRA